MGCIWRLLLKVNKWMSNKVVSYIKQSSFTKLLCVCFFLPGGGGWSKTKYYSLLAGTINNIHDG